MTTSLEDAGKIAAAVLSVLAAEARKGEKALQDLVKEIEKSGRQDNAVILALLGHSKTLLLTAEEAEKQITLMKKNE